VIAVLKDDLSRLAGRLRRCPPGEVGVSALVMHELFYGAFKSSSSHRNLRVVDRLAFEVLELTREDAREAGRIRARLAAQGTPIGPYDVLIAGQALARDLVLVTANGGEFSRIPDLRWEDWT